MTSTESSAAHRRTRQRTAVGRVLAELDEFRTAQEIHAVLREQGDTIGLATVYRTLQQMHDSGEVDSIRGQDGQTSYRRCSEGHHHHLICRECGNTVEISLPDFEAWADRIATEHDFTAIGHELELFGRCAACTRSAG